MKEFEWAEAGEDILADELERLQATILERVAVDPSTVLDDFELSESDRAQLTRPEVMEVIRAATAEQAVNGVWGWVDDDLAILHPWGFDVDTIRVPVFVRYGMTDVLVRPAHGEWLAANAPGCVVKIDDVASHLGSDRCRRSVSRCAGCVMASRLPEVDLPKWHARSALSAAPTTRRR